jgi:hypothetical protein
MMTKTFARTTLAALALLLTASTALAATGVAKQGVNIREGAGLDYDVVGQLSAGERVEIISCSGGWCEIDEGFVSASFLSIGGSGGGDDDEDDDEDEDEDEDDEEISGFDAEEGEFDEDPLDLEDDVPESLWSGGGDDDDDD